MKNQRRGISLIVLIITIIVIIILAAAIILSMTKANPIKNAKKAVTENDVKVAQEALTMWIGDRWLQEQNGTVGEEVGALYTGTITKDPSNIEMSIDEKTSTIQVTLEELGLSMLEELVIEKNTVKSIVKNGTSYIAGSESSGENIGGSGTTGGTIDSKELEKLNNQITQMQGKIDSLESELANTKKGMGEVDGKVNSAQDQIDHMLTTLDVDTRTTLFEGMAGTGNTSYPIADLSEYKYIIVYARARWQGGIANTTSMIINVNDITFSKWTTYELGYYGATSNYYAVYFSIDTKNSLYVYSLASATVTNPHIYKVEGIK